MTTQHSAAKSSTRPDIKVPVPFSSGTLTLKVYFAGGFSELSGRARDTILGSATTALLQFPTLLHQSTTGDSQHSDQSRGYGTDPAQGERQQDSETREARTTISNEYGQITVELVLENATVRVPEQIIRALNGTTASAGPELRHSRHHRHSRGRRRVHAARPWLEQGRRGTDRRDADGRWLFAGGHWHAQLTLTSVA